MLPILTKVGRQPAKLRTETEAALSALPNAYGSEPRLSKQTNRIFSDADAVRVANSVTTTCRPSTSCSRWPIPMPAGRPPLGSTCHAMYCSPHSKRCAGSHRVTSQNPEDQYQALEKYGRDLTEDARAGQARSGHRP